MKQKLFSIFCCLLLSASMVTQAQLLDAVNDSSKEGVLRLPDDGILQEDMQSSLSIIQEAQILSDIDPGEMIDEIIPYDSNESSHQLPQGIIGRNNAPQATRNMSFGWSGASNVSYQLHMGNSSGLNKAFRLKYILLTKDDNNKLLLTMLYPSATGLANYGNLTTVPPGTYTVQTSSSYVAANTIFACGSLSYGNTSSSYYCGGGYYLYKYNVVTKADDGSQCYNGEDWVTTTNNITAYVKYSGTQTNLKSGSVTVQVGRHGRPYMYSTNLKGKDNNTYNITVGDSKNFTATYTAVKVATDAERNKVVLVATNGSGERLTLKFSVASIDPEIGVPAGTYTIGTNLEAVANDDDGYTTWLFTSGAVKIEKSGSTLKMTTTTTLTDDGGYTGNCSTNGWLTPTKKTLQVYDIEEGELNLPGDETFWQVKSVYKEGKQACFCTNPSTSAYPTISTGESVTSTTKSEQNFTTTHTFVRTSVGGTQYTLKTYAVKFVWNDNFRTANVYAVSEASDGEIYDIHVCTNTLSSNCEIDLSRDWEADGNDTGEEFAHTVPVSPCRVNVSNGNGYTACLDFVPKAAGNGVLPSGTYRINGSGYAGTVNVGSVPYKGSASMHGSNLSIFSDYYYKFLRSGTVAVTNVNETYYYDIDAEDSGENTITFTIGTAPKTLTFNSDENGSVSASFYASNWSKTITDYAEGTAYPFFNGQQIVLTPVAADGYEFDSWTGASPTDNGDGTYTLTMGSSNISLTAVFREASSGCTYEVAFDANGGSGTMPNQEFTCGVAQNLNPNAFTGPAATITYNYHGATSGNGTPSVTVYKPFGVWEGPDGDVDDEAEVNFSASNGGTITLIATWNAFPNVTLPTPARTGYTFNGWYTEETGGTKKGNGGASFNPAGSITLHAQWTANTHNVSITAPTNGTITVSYNNGSAQSFTSGSRSIAEGTVLTVTTTPAADYHFGAWTGNGAASVTVDGAKTIGATFAQNDYFLNATYGAHGASVTRSDNGNNETVKRAGNTVTLTPNAASGYNFLAWAGADVANMSGNVFTFPANGTHNTTYNVQATFQANTYQVSFAAGDGSGSAMSNQTFTYGEAQNLTANTYTGPAATITYDYNGATGGNSPASETVNATFQNWRKDAVTTYTDGQSVSNLTATNGATVALTAEWEFTYEDATVTLPSPSKTGYTFDHWEYGEAPFFLIAEAGDEFTLEEDVTMTAQWNIVTYNLTYEGLEGATNTNPATYNVESETITLAAPGARDGYAFTGWTINGTPVTEITHGSTGDKTLTANWNAKLSVITLEDNRENSFYNTFKTTYDGATGLTVTYARQFTAGRWSTLCLPFSVNKAMFSTLNFGSRIYEFKYAEGNANDGSGVNLYFSIAKSIQAGKGYIVNADDKLAKRTSFEFPGVTINLSADKGDELNSVEAYDNLKNGCSTEDSNIELVGTLRKGTLQGTDKNNRYMGLKGNMIYYPNITTGSTILAYRGIFRSKTGTLNAERIRIIVDGEEKAELEVINGELQDVQETKKFIENGVLYIERNGIIYDATGRKVE